MTTTAKKRPRYFFRCQSDQPFAYCGTSKSEVATAVREWLIDQLGDLLPDGRKGTVTVEIKLDYLSDDEMQFKQDFED